jgi:hypothetical protein
MADRPATTSTKLTNNGPGPRSFFGVNGEQVILAPGESWEGEIHQAELDDIHADFGQGAGGATEGENAALRAPLDDSLSADALLHIARQEGYTFATDPLVTRDTAELRKAIEAARAASGDASQAELDAQALADANTVAQLRDLATGEDITIPPEATTKGDIALTIAQARIAKQARTA